MTIKYLSPHHSDDDPGGLIRAALEAGPDFPGPAEDLLLAWTLGLPEGADPREVAARILTGLRRVDASLPETEAGRLVALLRQTAAAGPAPQRPRRRGGARRGVARTNGDGRDGGGSGGG